MDIKTIADEHGEYLAGDYYDMNANGYCGVFMPEHVMRKMARLSSDYQAEVRRLLSRHSDELYVSDWTVANHMDGGNIAKQVTVRFVSRRSFNDVQSRIEFFKPAQPVHHKRIYVVDDYRDAKPVAESILAAELAAEAEGPRHD